MEDREKAHCANLGSTNQSSDLTPLMVFMLGVVGPALDQVVLQQVIATPPRWEISSEVGSDIAAVEKHLNAPVFWAPGSDGLGPAWPLDGL
jgi:hypothetical protein